jgi:hypothetical protein
MVERLDELKRGHIIFAGERIFKIAKLTKVKNETTNGATYEFTNVRSVPPSFAGGELPVSMYNEYKLVRFYFGNLATYEQMVARTWMVDMRCAAVGEGNPIEPLLDPTGFTKLDLMAYVMTVLGPQTRDDLLRKVAALEGLPWIPTSNTEYFSSRGASGYMSKRGKKGLKSLWHVDQYGEARAAEVIAKFGRGPALAAV